MKTETEKQVETYLYQQVKAHGGKAWKWTGREGEPDRIVQLPGVILFVEVKRPGGRVSARQARVHRMMRALGAEVHVVWSKEDVDRLLERFCPSKNERGTHGYRGTNTGKDRRVAQGTA